MYRLKRRIALGFILGACASGLVLGHGTSKGDLVIDHPYAIPSVVGAKNGSAYLRGIKNKGEKPDRLIGASTSVASRVELHQKILDGTVKRMRETSAIDLQPHFTTMLRHGGEIFLMLIDLNKRLNRMADSSSI